MIFRVVWSLLRTGNVPILSLIIRRFLSFSENYQIQKVRIRDVWSLSDAYFVLIIHLQSRLKSLGFFMDETHHGPCNLIGPDRYNLLSSLLIHFSNRNVEDTLSTHACLFIFVIQRSRPANRAFFGHNVKHLTLKLARYTLTPIVIRFVFGALFPFAEGLLDLNHCIDLLFWIPVF